MLAQMGPTGPGARWHAGDTELHRPRGDTEDTEPLLCYESPVHFTLAWSCLFGPSGSLFSKRVLSGKWLPFLHLQGTRPRDLPN